MPYVLPTQEAYNSQMSPPSHKDHEILGTLCERLETLAPLPYQESYDNAGLLVGDPQQKIVGVLTTLDVTEKILQEALDKQCNLIVAHHPIIFQGLKKITPTHYVPRTILQAIQNHIALYAIHTNFDNITQGTNTGLGTLIGLEKLQILAPMQESLSKLSFFCPPTHTQTILHKLHEAGAGNIGNYSACSFRSSGTGAFRPGKHTKPYIGGYTGQQTPREEVQEERVELIFPTHKSSHILRTLRKIHPYEEVAYYLTPLQNTLQEAGAGMIGTLPKALSPPQFLQHLKEHLKLPIIRHTRYDKAIQRVACCGGSGFFLLPEARKHSADAFITADIKYHDFFEADQQILLCDIGHYESEIHVKSMLHGYISENFPNIAVHESEASTNPIHYA